MISLTIHDAHVVEAISQKTHTYVGLLEYSNWLLSSLDVARCYKMTVD